jgi:hypothetical protein
MGRKVVIGTLAAVIAVMLFIGYIRLTGTKGIRLVDTSGIEDIPDKPLTEQPRQIDKTAVHSIQQSRYTILDPQTKRVKRVFGFENLLNPGAQSDNWQVRRPYMNVFENHFRCRLDADEGTVQVENSGGNIVPKDARLMGKVVIRLFPTEGKRFSDTVILMNDLNYSSERSEFFTDGPVELISAQAKLLGNGLQIIYNPQNGQIEYFRIKNLDSLRIKKAVASNVLGKSPQTEQAQPASSSVQPRPANKTQDQVGVQTVLNAKPQQKITERADSAPGQPVLRQELYYECSLWNHVKIRYGKQLIVQGVDEINILNLLWGSQTTESSSESPAETAGQIVSPEPNNAIVNPPGAEDGSRRTPPPQTPRDDDETDVLVTCDGGIVVKPKDSAFDPAKELSMTTPSPGMSIKENTAAVSQTPTAAMKTQPAEEPSGSTRKPARFEAQKLDYDAKTGSAVAEGPIRFAFYTPADANDAGSSLPVVITSRKNAEFLAGPDKKNIRQAVFHKDVVGDATEETSVEKKVRRFYGDTLTVDLAADPNGRTKISHVTVADGDVKLQAIRYRGGAKINHVELHSKQFDYEDAQKTIVASGPGKIELNNQQVPIDTNATAPKQSLDLRQPCYALVEGFDKLIWKIGEEKMLVEAQKDTLNLSYLTMKDNVPDKLTRAAVSNAQLRFGKDETGKDVLSELTAGGGVYLEQKDGHVLMGQTLHYTGKDGWIHIEGAPNRPCSADGAPVSVIDYNFQTGKLKTKLSRTPGAITLPQK